MSRTVWQAINGVLLLDKPSGMTSSAALQKARRFFLAEKGGHTGSLDPLATGVLPLCFGEATKFAAFLLEADKSYEVVARMGAITNTGDADGQVIETRSLPTSLTREAFDGVVSRFVGDISQVPPMYSALKVDGRKLYDLARAGEHVERAPRPVRIDEVSVLSLDAETFSLRVRCSKGTYIRTLVEDIGLALGCGAHVTALRRIGTGPFTIDQCYTLETLQALADVADAKLQECVLNLEVLVGHLPIAQVDEQQSQSIIHGQPATMSRSLTEGIFRMHGPEGFLGLGEYGADGKLAPKRLMRFAPKQK